MIKRFVFAILFAMVALPWNSAATASTSTAAISPSPLLMSMPERTTPAVMSTQPQLSNVNWCHYICGGSSDCEYWCCYFDPFLCGIAEGKSPEPAPAPAPAAPMSTQPQLSNVNWCAYICGASAPCEAWCCYVEPMLCGA